MSDDFPDVCLECLLKQPYHHDEPWTCPACGLIHAVVMPGVPLAKPGAVEKRPRYMTPDREEAIETALVMADWWTVGRSYQAPFDLHGRYGTVCRACDKIENVTSGSFGSMADLFLEAAALFRDGWSPGDKVVRK